MQIKTTKIFATVVAAIFMICGVVFAGSTTNNPTLVLTDTSTPATTEINNFSIQELGNTASATVISDWLSRQMFPCSSAAPVLALPAVQSLNQPRFLGHKPHPNPFMLMI